MLEETEAYFAMSESASPNLHFIHTQAMEVADKSRRNLCVFKGGNQLCLLLSSSTTQKQTANVNQLMGLMAELLTRQKALELVVAISQQLYAAAIKQQEQPRPKRSCFRCGKKATLLASATVKPTPRLFQYIILQMQGYGH